MTHDELRAEVRAIVDLHQRLGDHIETLRRRLHHHFDASIVIEQQETGKRFRVSNIDVWPPSDREDNGGD